MCSCYCRVLKLLLSCVELATVVMLRVAAVVIVVAAAVRVEISIVGLSCDAAADAVDVMVAVVGAIVDAACCGCYCCPSCRFRGCRCCCG